MSIRAAAAAKYISFQVSSSKSQSGRGEEKCDVEASARKEREKQPLLRFCELHIRTRTVRMSLDDAQTQYYDT